MKKMMDCCRDVILLIMLCLSGVVYSATGDCYRVGSFNIRLDNKQIAKIDGENCWDNRKEAVVAEIRKMNLDALGLQEVTPTQMKYLKDKLPEFEFVGEHRGADRKSDEASPVAFKRDRFIRKKCGTFWLSETPDVPGVRGWGAACPRVCSYLVLTDKRTGRTFCFANTHTDHISALARKNGMLLIVNQMKKFGNGVPIVFTGDHNCRYSDAPAVEVRKLLKDARDISESGCCGPRQTFHGFGRFDFAPIDEHGKRYATNCIDYIYVSIGTRVLDFTTHDDKRGEGLYISDHYPISATIEFK